MDEKEVEATYLGVLTAFSKVMIEALNRKKVAALTETTKTSQESLDNY